MQDPAEPDGIIRRAMRNLGFLVGGKSVSGVLGLLYLALAVRTLGVESYGQLVLIHSFTLAVATVVKFQTWQPILRYGTPALQEGRLGDFRRLVRFTLGLDLASSVVGMVIAMAGLWFFGDRIGLSPAVLSQAALYGVSLLFMVTATSNGLLRLYDRFDLLLVEDNVEAAVRLAGSLLLFLTGGTLVGFLVVWMVSVLASALTCGGLAWRETRRRNIWRGYAPGETPDAFPGLWKFVWATNANSSMGLLTNHVATLMVGGLLGPAEAALFRIARQIAEATAKPVKLMTSAVYPELARLVSSGRIDVLRTLIRRALKLSWAGAGGCFVVLALLGTWILAIVGGHETEGAYRVMLLLGAAALIGVANFALEPTLISLGYPSQALRIQLMTAGIYLPVLVLMIRQGGIIGAGIAAVVAALVTGSLQYWAVLSRFRTGSPALARDH